MTNERRKEIEFKMGMHSCACAREYGHECVREIDRLREENERFRDALLDLQKGYLDPSVTEAKATEALK